MNNFLTGLEPVACLISHGEYPALPGAVPLPQANGAGRRSRILYVDDEPSIRELGEAVLIGSGYAVDTAADGGEAWDALQDQDYHLLITDNQMPCLTGQQLIRKVRRARMSVPIILTSGMLGACPLDDLPWAECGAMLAKPFSPEQLVSVVHEVLRSVVGPQTSTNLQEPSPEEFNARLQPHLDWGINE
jgi:DNA-binding response OmpR family regulator